MLFEILQKTCANLPDKPAVICGHHSFTYIQLRDRVEKLAAGLQALGIKKHDKIAIIHRNCHRFLETYFAAAKLGAILVPVNHRLDAKDYIYILDNSQSELLIAQPDLISGLDLFTLKKKLPLLQRIIFTETGWPEEVQGQPYDYESLLGGSLYAGPEDQAKKPEFSDTAQIYYTSGTTGKPKGVMLTHANNRVHAQRAIEELDLTSQDVWLHVSPMFHLADAWAVWSITAAAGTHVLIPGFEPRLVLDTIVKHGITLSNFIPTMLNILVNFPGIDPSKNSSMRVILSGGAPIAKDIIRKTIKLFGCDYIQTYGLTETSPFLTMSILKPEMKNLPWEERLKYMATTGRPFHGVQLKVIKEDGSEVKPDEKEVGEIIVKGETVSPGYWRLPQVTQERIRSGWLYTRDLAVVNSEGYVTIVDRKDDKIITGGEDVYSIEVEDVLYSHPGILEAAVIGVPDAIWGEAITAVVVPKAGHELDKEEIISYCKCRLAHFKAPKRVIFVEELPKTGSAKICKYKLKSKLDLPIRNGDHGE